MVRLLQAVGLAALALTVGCGLSIPSDPDDTLARVTGAKLRVGVSPNPPWTVLGEAAPHGTEVDLVNAFAQTLDAEVEWVVGGEETMIAALEHGELHLVIGGLTAETPWVEQVAITKPYAETRDARGERQELVMAAPPGENAYLLTLEKFLLSQGLR
jgi:polar amino acid transport system substrate-binding protein